MSSYIPPSTQIQPSGSQGSFSQDAWAFGSTRSWLLFGAAVFLVSVPVFVQAPLVRTWPWFSLIGTAVWLGLSVWLLSRPTKQLWGDLLLGFTLSWLAGSIYWGWLRWEPLLHLPIEAIGLPLVWWGFRKNWYKVGNFFYLGSLLGTAITDLYFYVVDLIPYWRKVMLVDSSMALSVLQEAATQVKTPWGIGWAVVLGIGLILSGLLPQTLSSVRLAHPHHIHWWAFSGAVLSTILVDSLFWFAASAV